MEQWREPTFVASIDVRSICKAFSETKVGDTVTYLQLSELIGRDVQTEARSVLTSARKISQREDGIVFGTIYKVGLKRLSDIEIVQTGAETVVKIRRASRRAGDRVAVPRPENLPIESRVQQNLYLSVFAMLHNVAQDKQIKKLEERVARAESRLPLDKTLDAFRDEDPPTPKERTTK